MIRTSLFAISLSLSLPLPPAAAETPAVERDWRAALQQDAQALHDTITANHPGPHDTLNPGFVVPLHKGLLEARLRAETVNSEAGWYWGMRGYVAGFDDGHVIFNAPNASAETPIAWPGFLTVYQGSRQVVADRLDDASLPPLGATLVSCDGRSADELGQTRIGNFRGRWSLESQRSRHGHWQFLDAGNPFIEALQSCRFSVAGAEQTYALDWRPVPSDIGQRLTALSQRARPEIGLSRLDDGGVWISTPTFDGSPTGPMFNALNSLMSQMEAEAESLRQAAYIVLDLRGNGGGSSMWSRVMANHLWGADWTRAHTPVSSTSVDWRISDANIETFRSFLEELKSNNGSPEIIEWIGKIVDSLSEAQARGDVFWIASSTPETPTEARPAPELLMKAPVFVLTDSGCASACLDAVDLWKPLGAIQIGRETSADTVYMELRTDNLPSGLGTVHTPIKVYRGRPRGNNEPHRPAHIIDADYKDDAAMRAAVAVIVSSLSAGTGQPPR